MTANRCVCGKPTGSDDYCSRACFEADYFGRTPERLSASVRRRV